MYKYIDEMTAGELCLISKNKKFWDEKFIYFFEYFFIDLFPKILLRGNGPVIRLQVWYNQ